MKTKLTPLALLIPAVVLAQPAPQAPVPKSLQNQGIPKTIEQNALPNPAGINKAAAQALSKARSKQSANNLGREDTTEGGGYFTTTKYGSRFYCSSPRSCTHTR